MVLSLNTRSIWLPVTSTHDWHLSQQGPKWLKCQRRSCITCSWVPISSVKESDTPGLLNNGAPLSPVPTLASWMLPTPTPICPSHNPLFPYPFCSTLTVGTAAPPCSSPTHLPPPPPPPPEGHRNIYIFQRKHIQENTRGAFSQSSVCICKGRKIQARQLDCK